ncbi:MAG: hypothetical protein LUC98_07240 [Lachnospiraceae bacterium]|nr:hypothetical protein [Lachnospiraceae bacterium]
MTEAAGSHSLPLFLSFQKPIHISLQQSPVLQRQSPIRFQQLLFLLRHAFLTKGVFLILKEVGKCDIEAFAYFLQSGNGRDSISVKNIVKAAVGNIGLFRESIYGPVTKSAQFPDSV